MPSLLLTSNVRLPADKSAAFLTAASSAVAAGLGKPESYVLTSLQYADQMSFGGTCGPTCFAYVASIGAINPDNNNKLCASLCALVEEHLGVAGDRTYIQFTDAERSNFGW
jgi:phenylpyruvate tautomerase